MATAEHLLELDRGVESWNAWREQDPQGCPDLEGADLSGRDLQRINFTGAKLSRSLLTRANLRSAVLNGADLHHARLAGAWLDQHTQLRSANLWGARLEEAQLAGADLTGADLAGAVLYHAHLGNATLDEADARQADFGSAYLAHASVSRANLRESNLMNACLVNAMLESSDLSRSNLVEADFRGANLSGARVYGVSAWGLRTDETTLQRDLVITPEDEPRVTTDDIEVAQFVTFLLRSDKIRNVIDTVGKKAVLVLGRFTEGRLAILDSVRTALRARNYVPVVFNFDKPETRDFTETIRLLAGLSRFVIADITNPRSTPLELQATVPEVMIPFVCVLEGNEEPFAMFRDLWLKHRTWVLEPIRYPSVERLLDCFDAEIIQPVERRVLSLSQLRSATMPIREI